jgi:hypothetical protein
MLKLQVAGKAPLEPVKVLEFKLREERNGDIVLENVNAGSGPWNIISLRVDNGRIRLVRHQRIGNVEFATDATGRILETTE